MRAGAEEFMREKTLAIVGVSRTKGFGNMAMKELRRTGREVFPVNSAADEVEGEKCWRNLEALPKKPGAVVAVVPPAETEHVVDECVRLGIHNLWIQQGAETPAAVQKAKAAGLNVIDGSCVLLYAEPAHSIHRVHRWVAKATGRL